MTKHNQMSGRTARGMRMAGVIVALSAGLSLTGCPEDLLLSACETDNTATVQFTNTAGGTASIDVVWDGLNLGTLADGQTGLSRTVAAGIPHLLEFRDSVSGAQACSLSYPVPIQCYTHTYSCTG